MFLPTLPMASRRRRSPSGSLCPTCRQTAHENPRLRAGRYGVSGTSAVLSNLAIVDCSDQGQFIGFLSLKQAALQSIWLFQESLPKHHRAVHRRACSDTRASGLFTFRTGLGNASRERITTGLGCTVALTNSISLIITNRLYSPAGWYNTLD